MRRSDTQVGNRGHTAGLTVRCQTRYRCSGEEARYAGARIEGSIAGRREAPTDLLRENAPGLESVVSRYLPMCSKRAFWYLGNAADGEDAVQDALLSACKHWE
jgi:hypothetical protein